jgi:hypothetical protein
MEEAMRNRVAFGTALLALVAAAGTAVAAAPEAASELALATVHRGDAVFTASTLAAGERGGAGLVLESLRYRPRRRPPVYYRSPGPRPETFSQIHAGFLDPDGPETSGLVVGARGGLVADPHIQVGGQIDWRHRGDSQTAVISEGPGPGGTVITTRADLERSSSDLVPMLGFIQVSGSDLPVIPYAGFGAGYEVLHLSARDFQTGEKFDGTFGGFGWQVWGGAAVPLSGRSRVTGEVFVNRAEVSRDVSGGFGQDFRETVDMNGVGMRFGLQMGF